eukprot:maker-scaffold534_size144770-snap-gene-0.35 protein:Tk11148 transcript:maker-scaffold534_size144770-snap-gene-0.35-mRNA-1 annotation:"uncharacterized protein conserved in bacteria"
MFTEVGLVTTIVGGSRERITVGTTPVVMLEALFRAREIIDLVENMTLANAGRRNTSQPVMVVEDRDPHVVGPPNGFVPQKINQPSPLLLPLIIVVLVCLLAIIAILVGIFMVKLYLKKENGRMFTCDDSDCAFRGEIKNTGYNRLNCFNCDYDLCDSCAHRRMFILTKYLKYHGSGITQSEIDNCSICQIEQTGYPVSLSVEHFLEVGHRTNSSQSNMDPPDLGIPVNPSPGLYSSDPPSYNAQFPIVPLATYV